jgi:restriction system protein
MASARKGMAQQLWEAQQRRAREQEALERKRQEEAAKAIRAAEKAAERERAAAARQAQRVAEARQQRRQTADLRAVNQVMREMEKRETLRVRHELKEEAARAKDKEREAAAEGVRQRREEAELLTADVERAVDRIGRVLMDRDRGLEGYREETDQTCADEGAEAYADHVAEILSDRKYMRPVRVAYSPDSRRLTLVLDLPRASGIPAVKAYKYVASRDEVVAEPRKEAEIRQVYQAAIARLALCAADYAASVTSPTLVATLAVNAHVSTKDPATGLPVSPCLVTFLTGRERLAGIVLDEPELDPSRCLRHLDARVSPDPLGLEPVMPIVDVDAERSAPAAEGRVDLMALSPSDFERLIERLFLAMGYHAWKTRDSRDDGVDAVVTRDDLALGGVCVVQAKRTKNTVPVAVVRELAGTMQLHKAHTGMVVTTSTFGPASYAFAEQVGRIQLVDHGTLRVLLKTHLGMDVVVGSQPTDSSRTDAGDPPPADAPPTD